MTSNQDRWRQEVLAEIEAVERKAHAAGLTITAHTLNNAKNAAGWEMAGELEHAAAASKGIRPGEPV